MELQNFIRGRPSQDHKPGNLQCENCVTGRLSKAPYKLELQNFIRGRLTQDHKPGNLQYENLEYEDFVTGRSSKDHEPCKIQLQNLIRGRPSQDTNLQSAVRKSVLSLAGPAKTMNLRLKFQNFIRGRSFFVAHACNSHLAPWGTPLGGPQFHLPPPKRETG